MLVTLRKAQHSIRDPRPGQFVFRPAGGSLSIFHAFPRLTPWAAFLRRFAAQPNIASLAFGRRSGHDTNVFSGIRRSVGLRSWRGGRWFVLNSPPSLKLEVSS